MPSANSAEKTCNFLFILPLPKGSPSVDSVSISLRVGNAIDRWRVSRRWRYRASSLLAHLRHVPYPCATSAIAHQTNRVGAFEVFGP